MHHRSLYALAATVNEADLSEAGGVSRPHVLLHHVYDVTRSEGVEIKEVFYRQFVHNREF